MLSNDPHFLFDGVVDNENSNGCDGVVQIPMSVLVVAFAKLILVLHYFIYTLCIHIKTSERIIKLTIAISYKLNTIIYNMFLT